MDKFVINYLYIEIDMFVNLENKLVYCQRQNKLKFFLEEI